jgi:hypothetical protein
MTSPILEPLRALAVPVDNLQHDPDNARRGDTAAVRRSLKAFGQRKPVVAKRIGDASDGTPTGIVIAGNTTLEAAIELGWPMIAAVFVDDDTMTARAYALADNRTAELASWDEQQLSEHLRSLADVEFDMTVLGWTGADLAALLGDPGDLAGFPLAEPGGDGDEIKAGKTVTCPNCGEEFEP